MVLCGLINFQMLYCCKFIHKYPKVHNGKARGIWSNFGIKQLTQGQVHGSYGAPACMQHIIRSFWVNGSSSAHPERQPGMA